MPIDVNAKRIDSPTYKLIMYLNKYEPDLLEGEEIQFLFKNLKTHFKKLFYTISYIDKIQKNSDFMDVHDQSGIVSVSAVEYCYYKISTIFDIAYQVADKLIFPKKKGGNKYEYLESRFEAYAKNLIALQIGWYKSLNNIRNRIVHGGITVNPFYVNDERVKSRICFQAYNFDLDDLVEVDFMYSNRCNNNINFADNYFTFHTHLLYSYLTDFFEFVLIELSKNKGHDVEDLSLNDLPFVFFERDQKTWLLSEVDAFVDITKKMIALHLTCGDADRIDEVSSEDINQRFQKFPFTMMNKIGEGDWVLVEKGGE